MSKAKGSELLEKHANEEPRAVRWCGVILLGQVMALGWVGWRNQHLLNTDAIAYLRLATYYARGQGDLMISGYWGPLLSWLMAPGIALGMEPLLAARMAMGLSAVVFLAAGLHLLRVMEFAPRIQWAGGIVVALTGLVWSATEITPDLLLSGIVARAIAAMRQAERQPGVRGWLGCGGWWGLAYYAKAVAFPLAILCGGLHVGLNLLRGQASGKIAWKGWGWAGLIFLLTAAPWVTVLSLKYQQLTFSTSAAIGHAIEGPPDQERYHPYAVQFHAPAPGRLTAWEDPSEMTYAYWQPWASAAYGRYQVDLIRRNLGSIWALLGLLDLAGLGRIILLLGLGLAMGGWIGRAKTGGNRSGRVDQQVPLENRPWFLAVIPVISLGAIYLPVHATEARFYYPAFQPLLILSLGLVAFLAEWLAPRSRLSLLGHLWVGLSFVGPAVIRLPDVLTGTATPAVACAWELSRRLEAAGIKGPMAGSGMVVGERAGLYAAFLQQQTWHGDERNPRPESFLTSKAVLMVLNRHQPAVEAFVSSPAFRDLDSLLFSSSEEAAQFPLKVFQRR